MHVWQNTICHPFLLLYCSFIFEGSASYLTDVSLELTNVLVLSVVKKHLENEFVLLLQSEKKKKKDANSHTL